LMCKALHGRSGLHPKMLPQGLKYLARQMMAALYFGFRVKVHNGGGNVSTKPHGPWKLAWYARFPSKQPALDFERHLKTASGKAFARKRLISESSTYLPISSQGAKSTPPLPRLRTRLQSLPPLPSSASIPRPAPWNPFRKAEGPLQMF
jgi:predicted GIY-YIG superfamily endonuclease